MSYTRGHMRTKIWNLLGHLHSDFYQLATAPFLQNWFSNVITQKNKRSYYKPSLRSKPSIFSKTATFSAFPQPWLLPPRHICLRGQFAISPRAGPPLGHPAWNQGLGEGKRSSALNTSADPRPFGKYCHFFFGNNFLVWSGYTALRVFDTHPPPFRFPGFKFFRRPQSQFRT